MSGVAIAIGGAAVVGAVTSTNAANKAAGEMSSAAAASDQTQRDFFFTEQGNEAPYMAAGKDALGQIQGNMSQFNQPFTMKQFQEDPGYQFDLQQGEQALQNSAAASGHMISSQQMGNASNYAQSMASNEFGNAYNRYQTTNQSNYNRLMGVAQMGQAGASNSNAAAQNAANNISANTIGAGNAAAAGTIGSANAISGGVSSAANGFMNYNLMNRLMPQNTGSVGGGPSAASYGNYDPSGSGNMGIPQLGNSASMSSLLAG